MSSSGKLRRAEGGPMRYYDLKRYWTRRIEPHLGDEELNRILVGDFNKFTFGRWRKKFLPGMYPDEFESCDWQFGHRGPCPRFWRYVKHAACHWLVNFALRLATLAVPARSWRVVTSQEHSTVWDGRATLFDLQYSAFGVPPEKCWEVASGGAVLAPGEYLNVEPALHWREEVRVMETLRRASELTGLSVRDLKEKWRQGVTAEALLNELVEAPARARTSSATDRSSPSASGGRGPGPACPQ